MKRRSAEILQRLLDVPSHVLAVSALLDDYCISDKTLRADVQAIQSFVHLPDGSPVVVTFDGRVSLASRVDVSSIQTQLDEMDLYDYQLSSQERKLYIIARLLGSPFPLPMQGLADEMFVTRNTVINDCKLVDGYLAERKLELVAGGKLGISLIVSEPLRQHLLIDVFSEILASRHHSHDFFSGLVSNLLGYAFAPDIAIRLGRNYLRENNTVIARDLEDEIASCLVVLLNELPEGRCPDEKPMAQHDFLDKLILYVASSNKVGINLNDGQLMAIKDAILDRKALPQVKRIDDFDLYGAITNFLFLTGADLGADLQGDELLVNGLLSHVKSVMDWNSDSFEVNIAGPSGYMVDIVRNAATPHFRVLERYLHRPMDEGMKASIVIHICAALYRLESSSRPCNVLVASSSMTTGRYLEAQIKSYFRFNVLATVRAQDVAACCDELHPDFVVSTVSVVTEVCPVVVVAPMLTLDDLNKIQSMVFSSRKDIAEAISEPLSELNALRAFYLASGTQKREALDKIISDTVAKFSELEDGAINHSLLLSLLKPEYIRVETKPLGWQQGIRLSADCLIHDGCVTPGYVERAIQKVVDYGSYIVVNEGVALAHAERSDGALSDAIALLVHPGGIEFDEGVVVHFLFFFSQESQREYLELFHEVIHLGNDQGEIKRICGLESPDSVYRALVELLTDYS